MIEDFYNHEPYELDKVEKDKLLTKELLELTRTHKEKCLKYERFLNTVGYDENKVETVADIPFYPVRMLKEYDLLSIDKSDVFKTMTSSGTTGQSVAKIYIDKETALIQQKVMVKILSDYWGKKRLPILIVDTPAVAKDRKMFTARGAAILGLQVVARDMAYVLNDDMTLNTDVLCSFLEKYQEKPFIIFGFTFLVWQHFYQGLKAINKKIDMSNAWLMTGGGWKKLESLAVSRDEFKNCINQVCSITHFIDHYAMVEQTGCIYAECEWGHLHASIYSDVIVRNYQDFSICPNGTKGIIQVVSVLPHSYPGHSLLTEDEGLILGEDDCPCGRKGKYIQILGRMESAELRGCSDTYADKFK
jgi:hypothetical protein